LSEIMRISRHHFSVLAAQHLRAAGIAAIQWGDERLAHEIADKTGLAHEGPATMIKVLDRLEGSPFFTKSLVCLGRVARARRFALVNPGAGAGDPRTLMTAAVRKLLPRDICAGCGGTRSMTVDLTKYVGQIVTVRSGRQYFEAEVTSASRDFVSFTYLTGPADGSWAPGRHVTAGRDTERFDPPPDVTEDEDERWCECGDRAIPF
jgi:hypothetical protein